MKVILSRLRKLKIELSVEEGKLKINAPPGVMTKDLLDEIKGHKEKLVQYIQAVNQRSYKHISPAESKENYVLSSAQKRLYFLHQFEPDALTYNMPQVVKLEGALDKDRLEDAFKKLVSRHESLRTSFDSIDGEPVQKIVDQLDFRLEHYHSDAEGEPQVIKDFIRPFDLTEAPLVRVGLITLSSDETQIASVLMVDMHHIVTDGVSQGILIRDFMSLYNGEVLSPVRLHYKDYAVWQQAESQQSALSQHRTFWLEEYSDLPPALELPYDHKRPLVKNHQGGNLRFVIAEEQTARLKSIAESEGATLFMLMLSLYNILLSKLSNQEDIVIGTPTSGRQHADVDHMIGMFVNTLALRNYPKGTMSFMEFLSAVQSGTLASFDHQGYQYEELVDELKIERDTSRNPLFDVMFSFQNFEESSLEMPGLKLASQNSGHTVSKFDLTLSISENVEQLYLNFEYSTELFEKETIERFNTYFVRIVEQVVSNPEISLSDIEIISEQERHQILEEFNNTVVDYPHGKTVIELFEEQVENTPNEIAIVFNGEKLLYRDLNEKANSLSVALRELGARPNDIIAILLDQTPEMVIAILAILKSGAAFLPIDSEYPKERIDYILKDSAPRLILSTSSLGKRTGIEEDFLDVQRTAFFQGSSANPDPVITGSDLAYIIYTSGSTGTPKGTMIEHQSLVNLCHWHNDYYQVSHLDNSTKYAGVGFDATVWELFPYLVKGACIHIIDKSIRTDVNKLNEYFELHHITISFLPTQVCEQFVRLKNNSLRYLLTGGDKLTSIEDASYKLVNNYGPTENTVVTTSFEVNEATPEIPIGKPISNHEVYILDSYGKLLPTRVNGELCIGGVGLARGYLNRDALTEAKFVENPFRPGERMYKTGDLAHWLPDGNIAFIGRIDDQVQIRGYRIELGEIEHQLTGHDHVQETVVLAKEKEGETYLVAYYVSEKAEEPSVFRNFLSKKLPDYMVPGYYVHLDKLPLNANGKVDKRALPEPEIEVGEDFIAPANTTEEQLVALWSEVLKLDKEVISVTRSFFELGGHSLRANVLVNKIFKALSVEVPLKAVFQYQDIRSLSQYISEAKKTIYQPIAPATVQAYYPLSSAQHRMYFLYQFEPDALTYNMPQVARLEGELDKERLDLALKKLVARHESLRTSFALQGDEPVQRITDQADFHLEYYQSDERGVQQVIDKFIRPFDLSKSPLIRVGLISVAGDSDGEANTHILMVDLHHIITDGVSQGVLIRDFMSHYSGEELSPVRLHYKDYAVWQQAEAQQSTLSRQKAFWLEEYSEMPPVLELPCDHKRPLVKNHQGGNLSFVIDAEQTAQLKSIAESEGATLFMLMLSLYNILLGKLSNQEDIVIGTPTAGRQHMDVDNMIGMFVNTLVLRNYPKGTMNFKEFLSAVRSKTLACFDQQGFQYEELIDELSIDRDTSRNPLFDVMFSYQNFEESTLEIPGLKLKSLNSDQSISKFDLTLTVSETVERLQLNFDYSTELFEKETIEKFVAYLKNIVATVISDADVKLSAIEFLPEAEEHQLLDQYNNTEAYYPREETLVSLFEKQVNATPEKTALSYYKEKVTYRELNQRANQLAHYLRNKGLKPGSTAGLMLDRSVEMIIGILGILKAGGAYLPLDTSHPETRLEGMLKEARALCLLTDSERGKVYGKYIDVVDVNDREISGESRKEIQSSVSPLGIAYIIYTSGSTGRPKGVEVRHQSVVNYIYSQKKMLGMREEEKILQFSTISFDPSVEQIWLALLNGYALVLTDKETINDPAKFSDYIISHGVTHLHATPSFLQAITFNNSNNLRRIISGGEPCSVKLAKRFIGGYDFFNKYGPTEATISSVSCKVSEGMVDDGIVPIGKPIDNTKVYILDNSQRLLAKGVAGELYISGDGLARGYVNDEDLTKEKFVENPFHSGVRMYKTGDLARWLPDGNLEFLGRVDDQVKVRGFRIEPGEIAHQLVSHNEIKEGVVLAKEKEGENYLVAYYVSEETQEPSVLRNYLSERLPDYMVPGYYVHLDKLPLNANGKTDKKALPEPEIEAGEDYVYASNETEEQLVALWSEVLKLDKEVISVTRSFFELGGHSLRATVLANKIFKALSVEVPLKVIFQHQDIRSLSQYISEAKKTNYQSIEPAAKQEYYPLSSAQRRMYFLYQFEPEALAYNMPQVVRLEGALDKDRLEEAFKKLVSRHENLRTSFVLRGEEPVQRISGQVDFHLEHYQSDEVGVQEVITRFIRPFDLSMAPLLRVGLISVPNDSAGEASAHILMVDLHHIITDGVAQGLLIKDFMSLYNGEDLTPVRLHYKDYTVWQQAEAQQSALAEQKAFWLNEYSETPPVLELPYDHKRPLVKNHRGGNLSFVLEEEQTAQLKSIAESEGATLFMLMLSIYNILLSKLSNQEDIVIGTPTAGRQHADVDNMIGMFVNTLALRNYPKGEMSFREFLSEVQSGTLACFDHQGYQYEELIDELKIARDTSRNPLFDVLFSYQNFEESTLQMPGLKLASVKSGHSISKFDLTLTVSESVKRLYLDFEYSSELFEKHTIERFNTYLEKIVEQVVSNPETLLSDIAIITEPERQQILTEFNDTIAEYPKDKTVIDLFELQVEKTPDKTALIFEEESLSYASFQGSVNRMAGMLIQSGVNQGDLVAIMCDRSFDMMVGIFGILKSGAAYLPIDPNYPQSRIDYILQDSGATRLLVSTDFEGEVKESVEIVFIDPSNNTSTDAAIIESRARPEELAYVIYTSGSTGNPKGVMVEHGSLMNRLHWMNRKYPIGEQDVLIQKTPITFDVSVWELFWWSQQGAALCLLQPGGEKAPDILTKTISDHKVSTMHFVPSMLQAFLGYFESRGDISHLHSLRQVFCSGEALKLAHAEHFKKLLYEANRTRLINLYGPTEATIDVSYYNIGDEISHDTIPIGKPIDNINLYVLDKSNSLQPVGIHGELCIGGIGLSRGYLNNEKLTRAKFIESSFKSGDRIYRTGDLARWLPDGNLEFLGRIDDQVKIRGFRIELGEIEHHLTDHHKVTETVVLAQEKDEEKYLVAYYVSEEALESSGFRNYLSERMPDYMVPDYFVHLDKLPLTANGKIDRKTLPAPKIEAGDDYLAPSNETEEQLVALWSEVLKLDKEVISVTQSFFELGGHSLRATVLVNKIFKVLSVEVPLKVIFQHQDIRSLSQYIIDAKKTSYQSITPAAKREYYPLSSAQRRIHFLYQFEPHALTYNMPQVVSLEGKLDKERLEQAFKELVARHESLRTSFVLQGDEPVQRITDQIDFHLEHYQSGEAGVQEVITRFIRPFDLSLAPLIRVGLISVAEDSDEEAATHILMVDLHHIITDGVSQGVLTRDFMSLYGGEELSPVHLHYKDYAVWQQAEAQQSALSQQKAFWLEEYSGLPPVLELPYDRKRPLVKNHRGGNLGFVIEEKQTSQLKSIAESEGATLFMLMLSIYNILLSKLSNQEDIVIGTPTAGRQHADVDDMIGMFVNTMALRNYPNGTMSFREFLSAVQSGTLACFDHQGYQYEELVDELKIARDTSRNPLFDVMFAYQNFEESSLQMPGLKLAAQNSGHSISKFDMTLTVSENVEQLHLNFEYSSELFEKHTIERFNTYFLRIVEQVVSNPETALSDIVIINEQERLQILEVFNDTKVDYSKGKTALTLFKEQVIQHPDRTALVFEGTTLTYQELDQKSNGLASYLIERGIGQGSIVGLMTQKSPSLVIGILGILKAGGAYLPIDTDLPNGRKEYLLKDSGANALLVTKELEGNLECTIPTFFVEDAENLTEVKEVENRITASDLCYVIYTSGSTGKPKGVMIEHGALINYVGWASDYYLDGEDATFGLYTSVSFDLTVTSIFTPLISGNQIIIYQEQQSGLVVERMLREGEVSVLKLTPSHLKILNDSDVLPASSKIRKLVVGGEELETSLAQSIHSKFEGKVEIYNEYGPTEATVGCMIHRFVPDEQLQSVPIGHPVNNTQIYILDSYLRPVPVGIQGELYVSGLGVARGYVNNEALTDQRFLANPFVEGTKMYRTGDLVQMLDNGTILYKGRIDDQVKIRGYRIELGEIEHQLSTYDLVKEAVAVVRDIDNEEEKYLVGYYLSDEKLDESALKEYLSERLPEYMLPSFYVHLKEWPLTSNGKLDKKALPDPKIEAGEDYRAPSNEVEERLVELWSEVLKLDQEVISVTRSFFELGGHSLRATVLVNKVLRSFGVEIPLIDFFSKPTIKALALKIDKNSGEVSKKSDLLTLLSQYHSAQSNLFMIHDGSGDVQGYFELVKLIKDINCWGLRSETLHHIAPRNISIEEVATRYIEAMKEIQSEGPYSILGWSLGGVIAYEIAHQLESRGEVVDKIVMIDSHFSLHTSNGWEPSFSLGGERELLHKGLAHSIEELESAKTIEELWLKTVDSFEKREEKGEEIRKLVPEDFWSLIPHFNEIDIRSMMYYLNTIRTLQRAALRFQPIEKLQTRLVYIRATESAFDVRSLSTYFETKVTFEEVEGDHFSILQQPGVQGLAKLVEENIQSPESNLVDAGI
ncbi:MAG: amino acid adenylation domain-containing protein [Cytophagales bacterium]|nr:amino acid adenylation domain-containing protein [Cytophagales bacterium]